ncbi:MAG TPA: (2Fe-2S) ferredoxin domain-containing protein [Pelagibacterium sp.]|uniref:(2Fe-2S) ferredoxin domain-containing protein n=1 Tax=Pelagibacterium sp. TaxID=1967288 RepID=UPI002CFD4618|nr:(2Fe-2S) ferredoxin domain-containing protein [Pelagibacterium sp.]HWJ88710.1 (2Fe-2S) ferredoxin domain-containing protein [Pelagibacterium sp.]
MRPDTIVFVLSQYNLSGGRLRRMEAALAANAPVPVRLIRLEGPGAALPDILDAVAADGHRSILIQPLGLPFPEGLVTWLPGALGNWLAAQTPDRFTLRLGKDMCDISDILDRAVTASLEGLPDAITVDAGNTKLGKPGWQDPPDFTHHLLVCTGPRCQYRDSASLLIELKDTIAAAGLSRQCLTTRTGCMFPCNQGPMVAVYPRGEWYRLDTRADVQRFVFSVLRDGQSLPDLLIHTARAVRAAEPILEPASC